MLEIKEVSQSVTMISPCYNSCSSRAVNLKECVAAIALL